MGKHDKDRYLKELAVRFCLVKKSIPFLEVNVVSKADLSDSAEILTDIDVLGVEAFDEGWNIRTTFDCKSSNKMSSVNRAFWASGVLRYTNCREAFVLLKKKAVHNHRVSALSLNVDLHTEESFIDLGRTYDTAFPQVDCYQSSLERWDAVDAGYGKYDWSKNLYLLARHSAPLTDSPWRVLRKLIAELRLIKGNIDPDKSDHVAIVLDLMASMFVLWSNMARDIRRFYHPEMNQAEFSKILGYYIWGGKESYEIRQKLLKGAEGAGGETMEFPAWDKLIVFVGVLMASPHNVLECAHMCKELSLRCVSPPDAGLNSSLAARIAGNSRVRPLSSGLAHYIVAAGNLPKDLARIIDKQIYDS